jgi:hypothetical protein
MRNNQLLNKVSSSESGESTRKERKRRRGGDSETLHLLSGDKNFTAL